MRAESHTQNLQSNDSKWGALQKKKDHTAVAVATSDQQNPLHTVEDFATPKKISDNPLWCVFNLF